MDTTWNNTGFESISEEDAKQILLVADHMRSRMKVDRDLLKSVWKEPKNDSAKSKFFSNLGNVERKLNGLIFNLQSKFPNLK